MDMSTREVDDGAVALGLQDDGLPVLVTVAVRLVDQPGQHLRMPADPLEHPGQSGGRGLVSGGQQRQEFVGDVLA